jgi:hypothetical protein
LGLPLWSHSEFAAPHLTSGACIVSGEVAITGPNPQVEVYCDLSPLVRISGGMAAEPLLDLIGSKVLEVIRDYELFF